MDELTWAKSTVSGSHQCVEVAATPSGGWKVRNSKDPSGAVLTFTEGEWSAFISGAKSGEFD